MPDTLRRLARRLTRVSIDAKRTDARVELLRRYPIDVVLDVGANEGLFGEYLRGAGYRGRIVSFEPLSNALAKLESASTGDPKWECVPTALGASRGQATLNVAGNWASSSLLAMEPRHRAAEPRSAYVSQEECSVFPLDDLLPELLRPHERIYLKLDVQGSEFDVLRGAEQTIGQTDVLDVELSLVPLYTGAPLFGDVVGHLDIRGFGLVAIEPAFLDSATDMILQVNGLFARVDT
jgi:FkbM family methyltransferase